MFGIDGLDVEEIEGRDDSVLVKGLTAGRITEGFERNRLTDFFRTLSNFGYKNMVVDLSKFF